MTTLTSARPLDSFPGPRPLHITKTPCRTGFFLFLILVGAAVLATDRYLTNDAVRRVEEIEKWDTREMAQVKAATDNAVVCRILGTANEKLAGQVELLQTRLDSLTAESVKLLQENLILRGTLEAIADPADGPVVTPVTPDKEA